MTLVIAIDGPAGTGKSSAAKSLAQKYNFVYVDTGAIYRALAYLVDSFGKDPNNVEDILNLITLLSVVIDEVNHKSKIKIDDTIIDKELRSEKISRLASIVSQHPRVRQALLPVQRDLVHQIPRGAIFEGRDIGTVVFPKAPLKIFITANSETRAKRRYEEIKQTNPNISYQEILDAIKKRDERDQKRATAPMQLAADGHLIDTSDMTLDEVIQKASLLVEKAAEEQGCALWS